MWLNEIFQHLDPVALSIGPLTVRWYGLAYLAGFVCAGLMMYHIAKRVWKITITADAIYSVMIAISFGVIIGGRLGYVIAYGLPYYVAHPIEIFMISDGGMSFHGGLMCAIIAGAIAAKKLHIPLGTLADLAVIGAPIGLFFGRCANFINGELWGKPTDVSWAVAFPSGGGVFRHPSQLYEALLEGLLLGLILFILAHKKKPLPQLSYLGIFLAGYGIARILVEFVRVPDVQLGYLFGGWITMGQILSFPMVLAGIIILIYALRRQKPQCGMPDDAIVA